MHHFSMNEFKRSSVARERGIDNTIPEQARKNLVLLTERVLDPARERLGMPIIVNSGYRCRALNKAVGGSPTSQHLSGEAADISCLDNNRLLQILKELPFDQLIAYRDKRQDSRILWIHVSFSASRRRGIAFSSFK